MLDEQEIRKLLNLEVDRAAPTVIIFAEQITPRLNYVCRFIFEHVLKIKFVVTSGSDEFQASGFYKINYSAQIITNTFQIVPQGFLFGRGVDAVVPIAEKKKNSIYFFTKNRSTDFDYDVFSAVFYLVSRYEEWQPFEKDVHGRFELNQSILYKNGCHLLPVADEWIMELREALALFYPGIIFPSLTTRTIASIDVDNLFAYKHKGVLRTTGALAKDLVKGDFKNAAKRLGVLTGKEKDPFDIYEEFTRYCTQNQIPLFYFFLFRSGTKFDRTVSSSSPAFKKAITTVLNEGGNVGLHPSYETSDREDLLASEIKCFSETLGVPVIFSRQHYLKFKIRSTPRELLKNNIKVDFTMGFASGPGFRAGTSRPFFYYDFEKEAETVLLFVPFCAMDGAYTVYDKKPADEALALLKNLKREIKKTGGLFVTVFHERTFADHLYPGFGRMYKTLLKDE
ncbi:MAG: hypothetical protein H0W61_02405 [Bacteroidetes bacterium]|nr:hypothetical protein [Bacteroidota bacterium]